MKTIYYSKTVLLTVTVLMIVQFNILAIYGTTSTIEGIVLSKSSKLSSDCIISDSSKDDCRLIKYFLQLQQQYHKIFTTTTSKITTKQSMKQIRIDLIPNTSTYVNSFGQYILKNRPFKGVFSLESSNINKIPPSLLVQLYQALLTLHESDSDNTSSRKSSELLPPITSIPIAHLKNILPENSILDITSFLDKVIIPKYAANNYLRRKGLTRSTSKAHNHSRNHTSTTSSSSSSSYDSNNDIEENEVDHIISDTAASTTNVGDDDDDNVQSNNRSEYFSNWPSISFQPLNIPTPAYQCPAHMHRLIWTYGTTTTTTGIETTTKVKVRVFPIETSASYFQATNNFNQSIFEANNVREPIYFNEFIRDGFQDNGDDRVSDFPMLFSETILDNNNNAEYLFVPNTYLSSILCSSSIEDVVSDSSSIAGSSEAACPIVSLCFVDASNLNVFKDAMSIHGHIFPKEQDVYQELSSSAMDFSMARDPLDLSITDYINIDNINQAIAAAVPTPSAASDNVGATISSASSTSATVGGRDRRKRSGKKNEFRDWQDANKWNSMINALVLPKPSAPKIIDIGRDNVTLTWHSSFVPNVLDVVNFGFKVIYCVNNESIHHRFEEFLSDNITTLTPSTTTPTSTVIDNHHPCSFETFSRVQGNLREQIDEDLLKYSGLETINFHIILKNLNPSTDYQVRLILFYDQAESPPSMFSLPFKTKAITIPSVPLPYSSTLSNGSTLKFSSPDELHGIESTTTSVVFGILEFIWPIDDGGLPILGFHVYCRYHQNNNLANGILSKWDWLGLFPAVKYSSNSIGKIEINNLIPNSRLYQFKISAYNQLGNSEFSVLSNLQKFSLPPEMLYTVYGQGNKNSKGSLTEEYFSYHNSIQPNIIESIAASDIILSCQQDFVTIDSFNEIITLQNCNNTVSVTFDIWRSHWTSPYVSIISKYAIAKPIHLDNEIQNIDANLMKGRVVFCLRGIVPFTEKVLRAQEAGAVAVLVIDDGQCENYDQKCLPGANKRNKEGFGQLDIKSHWNDIEIPVYFILQHYIHDYFESINTEDHEIISYLKDFVRYSHQDEL